MVIYYSIAENIALGLLAPQLVIIECVHFSIKLLPVCGSQCDPPTYIVDNYLECAMELIVLYLVVMQS